MIPEYYKALLLTSGVICLLVGILLLCFSYQKGRSGKTLALCFFLLAYPSLLSYVIGSGYIRLIPHLYRTGFIAVMLFPPAAYLYLRNQLLKGHKGLTVKDVWHLLPTLLYIIDYTPFFLLPGSEKLKALHSNEDISKAIILFKESMFFPAGFYVCLKSLINIFYWVLQLRLLRRMLKLQREEFKKENRKLLQWLNIFVGFQASLLMPPLTLLFSQSQIYQVIIYLFELGSICAVAAGSLFFFPEILYGLKGVVLLQSNDEEIYAAPGEDPVVAPHYLSPAKIDEIKKAVEQLFSDESSYLRPHYTIQHLAFEIGISSQYISAFINKREQMNFNDYINKYRINYCIGLFKSGEHKQKTFESIACQCGFNNRNTFTIAFKKATGKTPSAYLRDIIPN